MGLILNPYISTSACLDPGDFPTGNAASCPDVDSVGTWVNKGTTGVRSSVFVSGQGYVINIASTGAGSSQGGEIALTGLTSAATFDVIYDYRVLTFVNSTQATRAWSGVSAGAPDFTWETDGTWREKTHTITLTSTALTMRFYSTVAAASSGNVIQIDNIRVIEQ